MSTHDRSADVTAQQRALNDKAAEIIAKHAPALREAEAIAGAAATEPPTPPDADEPTLRELLLVASALERASGHTALALATHVGADRVLFEAICDARDTAVRAATIVNMRIEAMGRGKRVQ